MKRPAAMPLLNPNDPHSAVYVAARKERNEQVGSIAAQRDSWRLTALASLGVAFVAVVGVV